MGGFAWVTLATNDSYSLGALVLAHSLKKVNTKYDLAVLITPGVTEVMREKLSSVFTLVKEVNVLDSKDETNLALLSRPELGITFTKLHCWRLTQYDKCVFIDADALVIKNSDELFERDELSAAPDVGWPDCFNSGVFVFKPSQLTFASLISHAKSHGSFDGGDQGLLNSFFSDWSHKDISKHLPFIYNMCSIATYSYLPAFKQFGEDVKIIHFIGSTKPWLQHFDTLTGQVQPHSDTGYLQPMLQHWWNIFCENVHPQLSPVMASSTLATTHWHDLQYPVSSKPTLTRHVCHDKTTTTTDKKTHDEIDAVPDFTNFRDPWEYYIVSTPENPVAHSSQQIPQTQTIQQQQQQQQQHQQVNQDVVNQISQSMSNITIQHDQNNNNNNTNNNDNNIQNQTSHDYPSYQYNQLNNIKIDNSINNNLSYQYEQSKPSTSRQIDYDHVEYTRHNLPDNNNNDGIDETDIISKKYNNIDNSKIIIDDNININLNDNLLVNDNNNPQSQFKICTKSNCIESKSDMNIINNIENNAGIAGALAKITLGETRTSEQVALEEHMRKYGWEQGQIDYMGRDSFDNIWKKINTTLESTSSKSDKATVKTKSSETEDKITTKKVDKLNDKTSENIPDDTTKIESAPATDKTLNEAKEILSTTIESSTTEQILAVKAAPQILSIKEHGENLNDDNKITKREQLKISKSQDESNKSDTVIPLGFTSTTTLKEDFENKDLKESKSIDTEQLILPISETNFVKDSSVESTNDIKIKTDNVDDKKITILPEDDNNSSKILSDNEQAQIKTDIKIPATPTIIEATPPTSPQSETTEEEIKAPKKIARKIIKKINHDDSIEGTSCTNKLINVDDNNTTELNENLEPDESVPETPPPSSVNPPTPPKRKSKNIIKKNNTE